MSEPVARPSQAKSKRARSVTESLLSIVLGLEAMLVFFMTMTAFGLKVVEPAVAFTGGAVLVLLFIGATRVLRYRWGVWVGWALQAVLVATGILMPVMYFIAAGFVALWIYCLVKGTELDRRARAQGASAHTQPAQPPPAQTPSAQTPSAQTPSARESS